MLAGWLLFLWVGGVELIGHAFGFLSGIGCVSGSVLSAICGSCVFLVFDQNNILDQRCFFMA